MTVLCNNDFTFQKFMKFFISTILNLKGKIKYHMQAKESTKAHCRYCFDVLLAELKNQALPPFPKDLADFEAPLFVTWKKNGELRGCIGTFQSNLISKNLPEFALNSAFNDHRFPPIKENELGNLTCSVSFLVNFEKGTDAYDWEIGKHGIIIEFKGLRIFKLFGNFNHLIL